MKETVRDDCRHTDCRYRGYISGEPWCRYMFVTGKVRNCKISECNKYKPGETVRVSTLEGVRIKDDNI